MRRQENAAFAALAEALGRIASLEFWPGDRVRAYGGPPCRYERMAAGFHFIRVEETGVLQAAPADSVRRA